MTKKLAISLSDDVAEQIRRAVDRGDAPSVSAYIAEAVIAYEPRTLKDLLEDWRREDGPPSPAVEAWADEQFARLGLDRHQDTA